MKDTLLLLEQVLYIHYPVQFRKNQAKTQTLIDFGTKVNAMTQSYVVKLGFKVQPIIVDVQKIDGSILKTSKMVIASF